jgi:D-alanyl-D-alanine carboxypeptidase/D-alanyl-D-alanine-endopeptidase (penicillin-binding protein 4)
VPAVTVPPASSGCVPSGLVPEESFVAALSGSRRVIVIIAVAVVAVVVAVGSVLWLNSDTGSSAAGGSTTSTPEIIDPPVVEPPPKIVPLAASDKVPTTAGIEAQLAAQFADPALAQFSGIVIDPVSGTALWTKEANSPQIPASTAKLLTGAALLTSVDPTSRFVTRVLQGDQAGDIVLVGGGDVTLSARNEGVGTVYDGAPLMADLAAQVRASGIDVKRIVLDTDYWTGPDLADGWQTGDIRGTPGSAQGYITRMSPLMVDGDREDPANENSIRTGEPAATAGRALARLIGNPDIPIVDGTAPEGGTVIGQVSSQPMSVLLAQALENSDNVLAEALARQVAIARGAPPSFTGASAAIIEALEDLGIDSIGIELFDGSGISTKDRVPPGVLAQVVALAVKGEAPALRNLLTGLPVAGVSGSLADRFQDDGSRAGAGWVRAKTGSLEVTYALAGYVPDVDGRILVFAFVSNGVSGGTRPALDALAAGLRGCGCV